MWLLSYFFGKLPTKMRNYPDKLLVPGELILAKVKEKKIEVTVPPALMLRDLNILLRSTAVTPEIKGPFPSLLDEWGGLEGAFRSTVPRSEGLGGSMGPLTSSYVPCGSREANEGQLSSSGGESSKSLR
ncbi:hypothetical protein COLO4_28186 [Corchorus olitorius]|uniref:Uncharacterized protein n=1 Tax=Corchorus olitorius TaxID=93759 RepID=A0A1R3HMR5_9ROSI|nr:hypothetical protein COLO4_28186 [Corchorus olitorius]